MKVFLCYGTPQDEITALRIQALATVAANYLDVYVPPALTTECQVEIQSKIHESNALVAIASSELDVQARYQIGYAEENGIPVFIVHVEPDPSRVN